MMLLFHAQYLNAAGHKVREVAIFAETVGGAYMEAVKRAQSLIDPIPVPWVTIQEDPKMFRETKTEAPWASPFKPVPVVAIPPLEMDVNGKIVPSHVMP